jgi:16S rRNA (guanine527-N7)-methyltransferase
VVRRLILDALAMDGQLPPWRQLVDLGSGAGFPGLPLALAHPDRRVVLVDARERRHHFQRFAIRGLAISNATSRRGRAEALEPDPSDLVVAQALAAPDRALELALRWVRPGGWIALPGGEAAPTPNADGRSRTVRIARYRVPCGGPHRTLWLGQRTP